MKLKNRIKNNEEVFKGRSIVKGTAEGTALVTKQSFGFLGSLDPETGIIVDKKHELYGEKITEKVLIFPYGIGSTMGAIYFLDAVRCKNSPAAIINVETEPIVAAGAVMAEIFYSKCVPVVDKIGTDFFDEVHTGEYVKVDGNRGLVKITNLKSKKCQTRG
jgi:predicted aconitase with swiveling domain